VTNVVPMRRAYAAVVCALALGAALAPVAAVAKDKLLTVLVDGRPMDSKGPSGLLHRGTAFVDLVRSVKAFDGLLIFGKGDKSINVTIRSQAARFVVGDRHAMVAGKSETLALAPFTLNGEIYVPLTAIATLTNTSMKINTKRGIAELSTPPQ
jgi:hypothetical protein